MGGRTSKGYLKRSVKKIVFVPLFIFINEMDWMHV